MSEPRAYLVIWSQEGTGRRQIHSVHLTLDKALDAARASMEAWAWELDGYRLGYPDAAGYYRVETAPLGAP